MIDFHTHSLISDGYLLPSELARRARVLGYKAIAITDHADESNLDTVIAHLAKAALALTRSADIIVIPGVELTHIPPGDIPGMVKKARSLGSKVVVGHGETLAEPVAPGTNSAFIRAKVDVLAHPGLVTKAEAGLAAKNSVFFEITARKGHSLSNGHVAKVAQSSGVKMLLNTDAHAPEDLISVDTALKVALGAGLTEKDFARMEEDARELVDKVSRR